MADINLGVGGANSAVGGYDIANSLKLEANNSEYMKRVMTATGNRKTFTISVWLKRTELQAGAADGFGHTFFLGGNGGTGTAVHLRFKTGTPNSDALLFKINTGTDNVTNRVFRDTSAWYHIVLAVDTTQATASDRLKLYVNGVQETSFATINYPTQNSDTQNNFSQSATYGQEIGAYESGGTYYGKFCGYLAEYNHIDGQALAPTEFGGFDEDSGIWKPKAYEGTYGTNGWYLDFVDAANLGDDVSGNGNDFTLNNISSGDQAADTPTNNFAIYNQLIPKDEFIIYQGGTRTQKTTATRWRTVASTLAVANGKWYAEFQNSLYSVTGTNRMVGVAPASIFTKSSSSTGGYLGGNSTETTDSIGFYSINGRYYINVNSFVWGNAWTADEIIGVALDMDNGYVYFSINGTWQNSGDPTSGSSGTGGIALQLSDEAHYIAGSIYNSNAQLEVNYGGFTVMSIASGNADANGYGNFEYVPPSGYYALCTKNLAEFG